MWGKGRCYGGRERGEQDCPPPPNTHTRPRPPPVRARRRLSAADEAAAASLAAALEGARAGLVRAEGQLAGLYRDKAALLEVRGAR